MVPMQEYMRENADNRIALEKGGSDNSLLQCAFDTYILSGVHISAIGDASFFVTDAATALSDPFVQCRIDQE